MEIDLWTWEGGTRPCRFALSLDGGCVFADFDVDAQTGQVFLVRISFDGHGCCRAPDDVGRMTFDDSSVLLELADGRDVDTTVVDPILRRYFCANEQLLWSDALR
jgi:hypothetical protein